MIGIDTETTGVDFRHGSRPFIVTIYDSETDEHVCWEWDVDPLTRDVLVPEEDIDEVEEYCQRDDLFILQNPKFDVAALSTLRQSIADNWQWDKTRDTLLAAHLLGSNEPKDLTTLAVKFLGKNISPYEIAMGEATKKARNVCRRKAFVEKHGLWALANEDRILIDMPSVKGSKAWHLDTWLPREVAKAENYPEPDEDCNHKWNDLTCIYCNGHRWWCVTTEYATADPWITVGVYLEQMNHLEHEDLLGIYETRLELLPIIYSMESRGITLNKKRLIELKETYSRESEESTAKCLSIAEKYDYNLKLPKSGNNQSLTNFAFGEEKLICKGCEKELNLKKVNKGLIDGMCPDCGGVGKYTRQPYLNLPVIKTSKKTGAPSLDKITLENYQLSLEDPDQLTFVTELIGLRKRGTAVGYLDSYERYWVKDNRRLNKTWYRLFSNLNPCGTDTLRFSSNNPNQQNVSKKEGFNLRYVFGPMPDREWWSLDAQNIELRIPAYESEEQELIDLFERSNEPPYYGSTHLLNFSTVYPDIWEDALKNGVWEWDDENQGKKIDEVLVGPYCKKKYASTWYQWCKNGDFAVQYGAVERTDRIGTADAAFHRKGSHSLLKTRFNKLERLNNSCINMANRLGYVETLPDRTVNPRRGYPLRCSRSSYGDIIPTTPLNYHVSGTAMWVMCRMMIEVQNYLDKVNRLHKGGYYIILQVHDELVFDFPKRENKGNMKIINNVKKIMGNIGYDLIPSIPLPVSVSYHPHTWSGEV